jgi:hypothetical protein
MAKSLTADDVTIVHPNGSVSPLGDACFDDDDPDSCLDDDN